MDLNLKIPDRVVNACKRAIAIAKKTVNTAIEYSAATTLILVLAFGALKLPEVHNAYLRYSVGSRVYMIRDSSHSGGGTGFAIQAPTGISYILTNDHVCGVSSDGQTVLVTGEDVSMRRRIIAHDENSDLCLIEGIPGVKGLKMATFGPNIGETMNVLGHPRLMPLHLSSGELTGAETIQILMGPISFNDPVTGEEKLVPKEQGGVPAEQCQMNKNRQPVVDLDLGFVALRVKFCAIEIKDAYISAVIIQPGNSGSPVVNFWGNVEGVAFASDSTNWGRMISIDDIKAFLQNY